MPESDEEVQRLVEEKLGVRPCLWQIRVVRKILAQDDVITIAATGSGKSLTYWMPLLFIKHGVVVLVTPLKLLGKQFVDILAKNIISAGAYPIYQEFSLSTSSDGGCARCLDFAESEETAHKLWSYDHCPRPRVFG